MTGIHRLILASRSAQRRRLLETLVPAAQIRVRPPRSPDEAGFEDVDDFPDIVARVTEIADAKRLAVVRESDDAWDVILAADTVIVAGDEGGRNVVLGQPPDVGTAGVWFHKYYFGREHRVVTAVSASHIDGRVGRRAAITRVVFSRSCESWLPWYLASGEPLGKAGGYALQGLASLFVERIVGSPSNVIGLPLPETLELLVELGFDPRPG